MARANGLSMDRLRSEGVVFFEAISREYHLSGAGFKAAPNLQPVYARHAAIMSEDSLALALAAFKSAAPGTEGQRQARMILEWQAESQSARELAPMDEREAAWETAATVTLSDGSKLEFERTSIEMANSADRGRRLAIEQARSAKVSSELAPMRQERFQRERDITEQLGLAKDYNSGFELLSGVPLMDLRTQCEQFLRDTEAAWRETYPEFVKRVLGIAPSEATRADALALFRARDFDAAFPGVEMETRIRKQMSEMGVDPLAQGRVQLDTGERAGKKSRAFCCPVRIPEEVHLVLRPFGGQTDWNTFLHELGHALHFANMRGDHPMEYRWLGDNSITESYAMLFDHLMQQAGWLKRYSDLGDSNVRGFLRSAGFEELQFLRRYCAKLIYETHLYGGDVRWNALPDLYVDLLGKATTFIYQKSEAFVDVDPRYYSARYLRAWQLQALLQETLTERFNEDWWRNPRAGPWVVTELYSEGQRELAHEQALRVSGKALSFAPLVRKIESLLG